MVKTPVLKAFRYLLRPLVRVLLRNGVTWREFAEIGKEVFVEVARNDYGIEGRPTNVARVALMTGLRRHEVARIKEVLAGAEPREEPAPNRLSQVLTGWHTNPEFLDADGAPAVLPEVGDGPSITTLLKRYVGDVPHTAVQKELESLGLIVPVPGGFRVTSRDYIRSATDPDLIRYLGVALNDHATTLAHNVEVQRTTPARFERMATNPVLPRRHVRAFQEFVGAEGQAFLERVDAWLAARVSVAAPNRGSRPRRDSTVRAGVGVYLIQDDIKG